MSNTHGRPDVWLETQAIHRDLLPPVLLSTTLAVPVPGSMTLTAFASIGYVRLSTRLVYVLQTAAAVPLSGSNGTYWLALHVDTHTPVATWTRVPGTHYLWCSSGSQPATPDGALVFASVTVATGVVTAVTQLPATTPLAAAWRTLLALGTMAQQNASAVAITGGTATLDALNVDNPTLLVDPALNSVGFGTAPAAGQALRAASAEVLGSFIVDNPTLLVSPTLHTVGVGIAPQTNEKFAVGGTTFFNGHMGLMERFGATARLSILEQRGTAYGIRFDTTGDGGGTGPCTFRNAAGTEVGYIGTNATTTTYSTASDARLKHAVAALTGALDVIAALKPVRFRWNADDSVGHGFLAHELQAIIPEAVSGLPNAVHDDGSVRPQQVDHSKLVPWLTAALQETLAQVEALAARVASLEEQLGL